MLDQASPRRLPWQEATQVASQGQPPPRHPRHTHQLLAAMRQPRQPTLRLASGATAQHTSLLALEQVLAPVLEQVQARSHLAPRLVVVLVAVMASARRVALLGEVQEACWRHSLCLSRC